MEFWTSQHWHLAWMIPAVVVIAYLGSPRRRGKIAFRRLRRLLEHALDRRRFTQFHGCAFPTGGGVEATDHVVVSRHGVFIIVSEYRRGELSGGEMQEFWKERRFGGTRRFPNPLYRARLQMESLQQILEIPRDRFQLIVALEGLDRVPKALPRTVLLVDQVAGFILGRSEQRLTPEQADRVVRRLQGSRLTARARMTPARVAQLSLALVVAAGIYLVYGAQLRSFLSDFDRNIERRAAPERFDAEGRRKSDEQVFEDSLACALSADTGRCACYRPGGDKVDIEPDRCRDLAERGSVLKQ